MFSIVFLLMDSLKHIQGGAQHCHKDPFKTPELENVGGYTT